ncbi:hypothetical protein Salat_1896100 [Sesamum alatum]|uniref:Uncharacterized protein n=1 Tax=Sesamum alatum TaxID=300844 RepID=A0AAE1Y3U4_9LAMI|nr:hypothetical protein Salat_1896100 [Sesamum alatum]
MNGGSYLEALNRAQPPLAGNKSNLGVPNLLSNQPAPPPCMVALPPPLLSDNRNFSLGTYLSIRRRCSNKKQINLQQPLRIHHVKPSDTFPGKSEWRICCSSHLGVGVPVVLGDAGEEILMFMAAVLEWRSTALDSLERRKWCSSGEVSTWLNS